MSYRAWIWVLILWAGAATALGDSSPGAGASTEPSPAGVGQFQHVTIDLKSRQIRVDCQALNVKMPLEHFCVETGGSEHESVLRTDAKPSSIHFGLLAMGLACGEPAHISRATREYFAPTGPPLKISCEFQKDGLTINVPAYRMMRDLKTHKEMPPLTWVFDGSRILPDGRYAADITGYVVSIVNFDLTMIDVPELASNSNETLEWEYNPDLVPAKGTPVTMIIEPADVAIATSGPTSRPVGSGFDPGPGGQGGQ
jgi:hypothetical protein